MSPTPEFLADLKRECLVAAAPELLAACKSVVAAYDDYVRASRTEALFAAQEHARRAVILAERGQPTTQVQQ